MLVLQCTTVGVPRVFSKTAAGLPWKVPPPMTGPPMASTVVLGIPAGSICTVVCESVIVYSLRITLPDPSRMTVGAKTCGIGNWVTNIGIVVGSSGVVEGFGFGLDADLLVPMEADLSLHFDMRATDTMARTSTPPDATEVLRFCFVDMFPLVLCE
jgi:hypothetical protein